MERRKGTSSSLVDVYCISQFGACPAINVEIYGKSDSLPPVDDCSQETVVRLYSAISHEGRILASFSADTSRISDQSLYAATTPELLKKSVDGKLRCACTYFSREEKVKNGLVPIYDEQSGKCFLVMVKTKGNADLLKCIDNTQSGSKGQVVEQFLSEVATYLTNLDAKKVYHTKVALFAESKIKAPSESDLSAIEAIQSAARARLLKVLFQDEENLHPDTLSHMCRIARKLA